MKKALVLGVLAILILLSGCGARNVAMIPSISARARLVPNMETITVNNNTGFDLVVQEAGVAVRQRTRDKSIRYYRIPTGESLPLGYYEFLGSSRISLVAKAYCPPRSYLSDPESNTAEKKEVRIPLRREMIVCYPGQYMGMTYPRSVYVHSGQNYQSSDWIIDNHDIRSPSGRGYY